MFVKPEPKLIVNYSRSLQRPAMLAQNPMLCVRASRCYCFFSFVSNCSIVFLAADNRIFLFFSTSLAVAHFSKRWCKGTNKAAIQTNASNINIGE